MILAVAYLGCDLSSVSKAAKLAMLHACCCRTLKTMLQNYLLSVSYISSFHIK